MRKHVLPARAAKILQAAGLATTFLSLAILAGCQGFSTSKTAAAQQIQTGTLALGSASVDFGSVTTGTSKTLTVTVTNSGTASVTISSASISSNFFSLSAPTLPVTMGAGQSATFSLVFTPNAAGAFTATATISSDASNASSVLSLSGTGVASGLLGVNPASESFGSVVSGTQNSQTVTLTNNSPATVNISQVAATGTGFSVSGITTPLALNVSQSTTFTATFSPQSTGSASGKVTVTSDAPNPSLILPLSGTGVAPGAVGSNPTSLSFGTVQVGASQKLSDTLTNTGGSSLTISQIGISAAGFTLSGITTPVTLAAGQTATFSVTFAPSSAASSSGNV